MYIKKWLSGFLSGVLCLTQVNFLPANAVFSANYAEALQKAIYFYECQQAGNVINLTLAKRGEIC